MRHSFAGSTFDPSNFKTYFAHCHCGAVRYKADVSPPLEADHEVTTCDCSMCFRTGSLNVYIPVDKVTWIQGKDTMKSYQYLANLRNFCPHCGTQMTITLAEPGHEFARVVALNVRAFQNMDYEKVRIRYVSMKNEEPVYDVDEVPKLSSNMAEIARKK